MHSIANTIDGFLVIPPFLSHTHSLSMPSLCFIILLLLIVLILNLCQLDYCNAHRDQPLSSLLPLPTMRAQIITFLDEQTRVTHSCCCLLACLLRRRYRRRRRRRRRRTYVRMCIFNTVAISMLDGWYASSEKAKIRTTWLPLLPACQSVS
jgi:hypothetical protein